MLLVEGFKGLRGHPRIEVLREVVAREIEETEEVLCVVTDVEGLKARCPVLGLNDVDALADLLVSELKLDTRVPKPDAGA